MPSRKPYATGLSPTATVRYSGRTDATISDETSVSRLTTPSSSTVEETRLTVLPAPGVASAPGRSRSVTYTSSPPSGVAASLTLPAPGAPVGPPVSPDLSPNRTAQRDVQSVRGRVGDTDLCGH